MICVLKLGVNAGMPGIVYSECFEVYVQNCKYNVLAQIRLGSVSQIVMVDGSSSGWALPPPADAWGLLAKGVDLFGSLAATGDLHLYSPSHLYSNINTT